MGEYALWVPMAALSLALPGRMLVSEPPFAARVVVRQHRTLRKFPLEQVFCLPIPGKQKRQHNFIVFPVNGDGVNPLPEQMKASSPPEPIQWTFEEATGKNIVEGEDPGPQPIADAINQCLAQAGARGIAVVFPDANEFASATREVHRPKEHAFHVKAHRGSKEGAYSIMCLFLPPKLTISLHQAFSTLPQ
jgi:hypothetical protein